MGTELRRAQSEVSHSSSKKRKEKESKISSQRSQKSTLPTSSSTTRWSSKSSRNSALSNLSTPSETIPKRNTTELYIPKFTPYDQPRYLNHLFEFTAESSKRNFHLEKTNTNFK